MEQPTSASPKSGSVSARPATKGRWKTKRTLRRRVDMRPIENEDLPYIYAAYRKGLLHELGDEYQSMDMDSDEFDAQLAEDIVIKYGMAWTLFAEGTRGYMPVGMVVAFAVHNYEDVAAYAIIAHMIWFPWSTPRNRVEAGVNFFSEVRHETPLMEYALPGDEKYFKVMASHGVMRRVGTSYNVYKGGVPAAVFETTRGRVH